MEKGNRIHFTYKGGRRVGGIIDKIIGKTIVVKLETDYKGKNDEWFEGELKSFNLKEMKAILITNQ